MMNDFNLGLLVAASCFLLLLVLLVLGAALALWTQVSRYRDVRITRDDSGEVTAKLLLRGNGAKQ